MQKTNACKISVRVRIKQIDSNQRKSAKKVDFFR
jgi:hypothetical protein